MDQAENSSVHTESIVINWKIKSLKGNVYNFTSFDAKSELYICLYSKMNVMFRYRITFKSDLDNVQSWYTEVLIKDIKGQSRYLQRHWLEGKDKFSSSVIWEIDADILEKELAEHGGLSFYIFLRNRNVETLHKEIHNTCIQTSRQKDDVLCLDSLSSDFCNMLQEDSCSDVVLKVGDASFPAHKMVLSSRSEIFSAMFQSDMKESRDGIVEVDDIEPTDLQLFLKYIYGGKVDDLTEECARRLYVIADKYVVESLKKKCVAFLVEILTEGNACSTLLLAETHNDSDFKSSVIDFIVEKEQILESEEWSRMSEVHTKVGVEVFKAHFQAVKTRRIPNSIDKQLTNK